MGSATIKLTHYPHQARVEINPKVMVGKPVIRGTRITVELILRKLAQGATAQDILDAYPHLTADDIQAAIGYAADKIAQAIELMDAPPETAPSAGSAIRALDARHRG